MAYACYVCDSGELHRCVEGCEGIEDEDLREACVERCYERHCREVPCPEPLAQRLARVCLN